MYETRLRGIVRKLNDRIDFYGNVSLEKLFGLLRPCDIFVLLSLIEGLLLATLAYTDYRNYSELFRNNKVIHEPMLPVRPKQRVCKQYFR